MRAIGHRSGKVAGCCALLALACGMGATACKRETRDFHGEHKPASIPAGPQLSPLQPGKPKVPPEFKNGYEENAYALSEGKNLFSAFNCVGCHAHGGGSIGPALMDGKWRYGYEPQQVYATIMAGRPNGMPAFQGKLTDQQAWQLAAYVRSLSGLVRMDAAPNRDDHMTANPPETSMPRQEPQAEALPPPHP